MSFMDELQALTNQGQCKVSRWLNKQTDTYRTEILLAIASGYASKTIWQVIVNRDGMVFSESVFARHRKGECCCGIQG